MDTPTFRSFIIGGFECSTHRLPTGKRLDLCHSTRHDQLAASDYRLLQRYGILTARDGLRWHLIERSAGRYDFSSAVGMLQAARETGMQVIWDLALRLAGRHRHFLGCVRGPLHRLRVSGDQNGQRLRRRAADLADQRISFFSWAGGEGGIFNPFAKRRGNDMKRQLVRATVNAVERMREINPAVRIVQIDPIINVVPRSDREEDRQNAEGYRKSQFEAWDMIMGRAQPELGGRDDLVDIIGVNYYIHNQFVWEGQMIVPSDPRYRHVSVMLQEVYDRYRRPLFVAETGIEDETRPAWLRYMCKEVFTAMTAGVPVGGVCLYRS